MRPGTMMPHVLREESMSSICGAPAQTMPGWWRWWCSGANDAGMMAMAGQGARGINSYSLRSRRIRPGGLGSTRAGTHRRGVCRRRAPGCCPLEQGVLHRWWISTCRTRRFCQSRLARPEPDPGWGRLSQGPCRSGWV